MKDANPNNYCDFEVSLPIEAVFENLISISEKLSGRRIALNAPADESALDKFEELVANPLPEEYRKLYRLADGQISGDGILPIFHDGFEFISLSDATYQWNSLKELWQTEPGFRIFEEYQGAVNGYWWSLQWIPFGYVCSGDLVCTDLDPTPLGATGQVVEFIHDDADRPHLGLRISSYLGRLAHEIESGQAIYNTEYGCFDRES